MKSLSRRSVSSAIRPVASSRERSRVSQGRVRYSEVGNGVPSSRRGAVRTTAMVLLIIGTAAAFSWLMAFLRVPASLVQWMNAVSDNPLVILLLINLLLLVVGAFLDMSPAILLLTPVLLPITTAIGLDPIQLGLIMILNLGIGLFTPPVGTTLYISTSIGKIPIEQTVKALVPFYAVSVLCLLAVTFIPVLTSLGR